jgi:hypothetical protein
MRRALVEGDAKLRRLMSVAEHAQPVPGLPESFWSSVRITDFPTGWHEVREVVKGAGKDGDSEEEKDNE